MAIARTSAVWNTYSPARAPIRSSGFQLTAGANTRRWWATPTRAPGAAAWMARYARMCAAAITSITRLASARECRPGGQTPSTYAFSARMFGSFSVIHSGTRSPRASSTTAT